ncbi:hypothetical protein PWG15_06980 [Ensifer adhaerens]|nr:hypothetical protein [Ensifer adhaerens]WDZ78234.1 hypothetical protein PWG15_06980 [Ensifer adhaerens]
MPFCLLAGLIAYDKATIGEVVSRLIAKGLLIHRKQRGPAFP